MPLLVLIVSLFLPRTTSAQSAADQVFARADRHALIIGVGNFKSNQIPRLDGVSRDMDNARRLARAMGVAEANTTVLRDADATVVNIRAALRGLAQRVKGDDRVFVYFAGHGTRYELPGGRGECTEGLVANDTQPGNPQTMLSGADLKADLAPVIARSEKLMLFLDTCHSGGTLTLRGGSGGGSATGRFMGGATASRCSRPSNELKLRGVNVAAVDAPTLANNVVQVSSAQPDQVALEDPQLGGLATAYWTDCAVNAQRAGKPASVDEISRCAQQAVDGWFKQNPRSGFTGQNLVVRGNVDFVPLPVNTTATTTGASGNLGGTAAADTPNAGAELLRRIHAQRDDRHKVELDLAKGDLKIGRDELSMRVRSDRGGYLYLLLHSSDGKSTYMLFPNGLDQNNALRQGEWMNLPAPNWRMPSEGPPGNNRLLAVVAQAKRDMTALPVKKEGPFLRSIGGDTGLDAMAWVMGQSGAAREGMWTPAALRGVGVMPACSDAFGAALTDFTEYR